MLLSTININRCGRLQKIRLISNAICCSNFGTIPAAGTRPNCSNMLVLKCSGCIHPTPSSYLQVHHFNQTAAISSTTKSLTKTTSAGNEQQPKPSESIETNENQQQAKSSPETTGEEQQKQQNEMDEPQHFQLVKASIAIGPNKNIEIEFRQGAHGHRAIQINRLPNIPVPQDAYKFVAAMDRLIGQLPVEKPANSENIASERVLAFQMLEKGQHNNYFNLFIVWRQEIGQWHLHIHSVKTWEKLIQEKEAHFPLWTLPKLRQQMATMLTENDGSERIDEMPTMPEWAKRDLTEGQQESNEELEQTKGQIKADQALPVLLAKTSIIVGQNNRKQMVEMLAEHGGTQQINEMPTIPEWATREKVEEKDTENKQGNGQSHSRSNESAGPQQQIETKMQTKMAQPKPLAWIFAKSSLPLGPNQQLKIECEQGRSGHKTINIYKLLSEQKLKLPRVIEIGVPKIHVPKEAYKFVLAMDRLISQLPVEVPANPSPAADESPPFLANQMVEGGLFYDFQLSVLWFKPVRHWVLQIRSVKTVQEHNEKRVQIPLWTLPLLRQKMATFLEKLDGTQRINKMPTMPEWATQAPNILQSRYSN